MTIAIRELSIGDTLMLEELLDAVTPGWRNALAPGASGPLAFIAEPRTFVFGAYVDNAPAGWLWGIHVRRPTGRLMTYVHEVDVVAEHRRRGVARLLVDATLALARSGGSDRLWLVTDTANGLYKTAGATRRDDEGQIVYSWDL
ncbi:MAG: GNAT family N-acetyltransferase [Acidimicrobiales bacterium]